MKSWVVYAIISACFAGFTSVIAKQGLVGISAELGLTIRTLFVCGFVLSLEFFSSTSIDFKALQKDNYIWLSLSALTTTGSWFFTTKH